MWRIIKENGMRKRVIITLTTLLILVGLFPRRGEGINEGVYYFGFPDTFLTWYSREFLYRVGSDSSFMFSFDLFQFVVNIFAILGALALVYKIIDTFNKRKSKQGSVPEQM